MTHVTHHLSSVLYLLHKACTVYQRLVDKQHKLLLVTVNKMYINICLLRFFLEGTSYIFATNTEISLYSKLHIRQEHDNTQSITKCTTVALGCRTLLFRTHYLSVRARSREVLKDIFKDFSDITFLPVATIFSTFTTIIFVLSHIHEIQKCNFLISVKV